MHEIHKDTIVASQILYLQMGLLSESGFDNFLHCNCKELSETKTSLLAVQDKKIVMNKMLVPTMPANVLSLIYDTALLPQHIAHFKQPKIRTCKEGAEQMGTGGQY